MNFFRKMNRSQKRKFDKLDKQEKIDIVTHEMNEKIKSAVNRAVGPAFADGILFQSQLLYEKYFEKWRNATPSDREEIVKEMMENIKKSHEKYIEKHPKKVINEQESENE